MLLQPHPNALVPVNCYPQHPLQASSTLALERRRHRKKEGIPFQSIGLPYANFDTYHSRAPRVSCICDGQRDNFRPLEAHLMFPLLFLALSVSKNHFQVLNSLAWDVKAGKLLIEVIFVPIADTQSATRLISSTSSQTSQPEGTLMVGPLLTSATFLKMTPALPSGPSNGIQ